MMPTSDCPPPSVLDSIAAGGIQEPLLGVYLDHLAECDACCTAIERWSRRPGGASSGGGEGGGDAPGSSRSADRIDRLAPWLDSLKARTSLPPVEESLAIGRRVGPFRIAAVLGEGASSVVYEALDEDLGRRVVLKVWRSASGDDAERRRMIVAEARALAAVQHESIMPLLQLLWVDELPVLVFPRLPGETLADALATARLSWRDGLDVVRQVARGLGHAHARGICHHDVKPSNIWLHRRPGERQPSALLFDFGLSGVGGESFGTPGYRDPAVGSPQPPESRDVFSLGVVLHECMAGLPDAPRECRTLVARLTGEPADLRPGALAVAADLDRLLESPLRTSWAAVAAAAFAAAALFLVGSRLVSLRSPPAARVSDEATALVPETVIPAAGVPVAYSADATLQCVVDEGPSLRIRDLRKDEDGATIALPFLPDRVAVSPDGRLVAVAVAAGDVAIVDVPSAGIVSTRRFEGGVTWIGWSGWQRDALAVLTRGEVQAIFFRPDWRRDPEALPRSTLLPTGHGDVIRVASLSGSESMVSLDGRGKLTVWSIGRMSPDIVMPAMELEGYPLNDVAIGWKNPGVCFMARGRRVTEFASHAVVGAYAVLAPVRAISWFTDSEYVLLSDGEDGRSRLTLGDSRRPGWRREFDVGDEPIDRIEVSEDRRQVVAVTHSGGARVYRLRP